MLLHVAHFTTAGVCLRDNRALASPSIDVRGSNVQAQRIFEFLTNPSDSEGDLSTFWRREIVDLKKSK
jgi:hypothetical protein